MRHRDRVTRDLVIVGEEHPLQREEIAHEEDHPRRAEEGEDVGEDHQEDHVAERDGEPEAIHEDFPETGDRRLRIDLGDARARAASDAHLLNRRAVRVVAELFEVGGRLGPRRRARRDVGGSRRSYRRENPDPRDPPEERQPAPMLARFHGPITITRARACVMPKPDFRAQTSPRRPNGKPDWRKTRLLK